MGEIKLKNTAKVKASVFKKLNELIRDEGVLTAVADTITNEIKSGKNPKTGKNYKALKASTIKHRKYLSRGNPTDKKYSPRRSNLTITGELLNGLMSRINVAKSIITVLYKGSHPGYKTLSGKKIKGSGGNRAKIADHLADQGRPTLIFSERIKKLSIKNMQKALRRALKRIINR